MIPVLIFAPHLVSFFNDKPEVVEIAKKFAECGFDIMATGSTHELLVANGINSTRVNKMCEGRPHIGDEVMNGNIQLIVNTPKSTEGSKKDDSYIRQTAVKAKVPYFTTMAAAKATADGIYAVIKEGDSEVMSLQDIHAAIE